MATLEQPKTREALLKTMREATKSYVSTAGSIEINDAWCKGCGICVQFCPKDVLQMTPLDKVEVVKLEACTKCLRCEQLCPDFAIVIFGEPGRSAG